MILNQLQHVDDEYLGSPYLPSEQERLAQTASCLPKSADLDPQCNLIGELMCKLFDMPVGAVSILASQYAVLKGAYGVNQVRGSATRG